jgi:hypothetical protein
VLPINSSKARGNSWLQRLLGPVFSRSAAGWRKSSGAKQHEQSTFWLHSILLCSTWVHCISRAHDPVLDTFRSSRRPHVVLTSSSELNRPTPCHAECLFFLNRTLDATKLHNFNCVMKCMPRWHEGGSAEYDHHESCEVGGDMP